MISRGGHRLSPTGTVAQPRTTKNVGRLARLRRWTRTIKQDVVALYIAGYDSQVPWHVKAAAAATAAYALSPIDPIPDGGSHCLMSIPKKRVMRPFRQDSSARRKPEVCHLLRE